MTTSTSLVPIANQPSLYIQGMELIRNATTPNTKLDISTGMCRDSTDTFDIPFTATVTVNAAINGANGLDTGTFAASKLYYVHAIFDATGQRVPAAIISLSRTAPVLPFGYGAFRWIGQYATNASTQFLKTYNFGTGSLRTSMFDAPQATAVTAGNATAYTNIDLSALVPAMNDIPVYVDSDFTPGAASRTLKMQPASATGDAVTITGQVTAVHVTSQSKVLTRLVSALPNISYKVANSGDAVAINVGGFDYSL